jgi:site-specific recombinase XerC
MRHPVIAPEEVSQICKVMSNLRAMQTLLGHPNIDNIFDYLVFHIDDANRPR